MSRWSVNQFRKAIENEDDLVEQNRIMEQVSIDFVDLLNQIAEMDAPVRVDNIVPKTAADVKHIVGQCMWKLRMIREALDRTRNGALGDFLRTRD